MAPDARDLIRGLDTRERAILVAIYEHKVLVTQHLKAMFFGSLRAPRTACAISRTAGS